MRIVVKEIQSSVKETWIIPLSPFPGSHPGLIVARYATTAKCVWAAGCTREALVGRWDRGIGFGRSFGDRRTDTADYPMSL